jgi:hypothetical protein
MTLSNKIKWHQSDIHETNKHASFIMNFFHSKNKQEQTRRCGNKTERGISTTEYEKSMMCDNYPPPCQPNKLLQELTKDAYN